MLLDSTSPSTSFRFLNVRRVLANLREEWRHPHLRIKTEPKIRPSIHSIYYFINQLGKHKPEGLTHNEAVGYHELPFPELKFKVSRNDLKPRIERILNALEVRNKVGVDFGCAVGGITFALQQHGAKMAGIDRDRPSLQVAEECEAYFKTGARFIPGELSIDLCLKLLSLHHNASGKWDFAIWLSSFNWISKALGAEGTSHFLKFLATKCECLVMDSAIGGKGQEALDALGISTNNDFRQYIIRHTGYSVCDVIGVDTEWYGREVYKFSHSTPA